MDAEASLSQLDTETQASTFVDWRGHQWDAACDRGAVVVGLALSWRDERFLASADILLLSHQAVHGGLRYRKLLEGPACA